MASAKIGLLSAMIFIVVGMGKSASAQGGTLLPLPANRVLSLDSDGDYVQLPADIFTDLDSATIECWVKWEDFGYFSQPIGFGKTWQAIYINNWEYTSDLQFVIYVYDKQVHRVKVDKILRRNQWYHIAAVSGKGGMKLYLNGILVGEDKYTGSFSAVGSTDMNAFGRSQWKENTDFSGQIDEIRVWKVARTQEQIRSTMHQRLTGSEEDLVGLWNFDFGDASDQSANSNDGQVMGGAQCLLTELPTPEGLPVLSVVLGQVTDVDANPLPNTDLRLLQNEVEITTALTDKTGRYRIVLFPTDKPYDLCASHGESGEWVIGLSLGQQNRVLNLELKEAISISGKLLAFDRTPQVNVVIQAMRNTRYGVISRGNTSIIAHTEAMVQPKKPRTV